MTAAREILANINVRKNAEMHNPVISKAVADMIGSLGNSVASFNPLEDAEIILAPLPNRFTTAAYAGMARGLDFNLKLDLQAVVRMLENAGTTFRPEDRMESFNDIELALQEMYDSEAHSYESGFEDRGTLHRIASCLNVRDVYHDAAEKAARVQRKEYQLLSIDAQVGNPKKQEINKNELANMRMQAMTAAGIQSDVPLRTSFDQAVIWLKEVNAKAALIENYLSMGIVMPDGKKGTKQQIEMFEASERVDELAKYLENLNDMVRSALMTYNTFIENKQAMLDKWYQDELNRIPVVLATRDFCMKRQPDNTLSFDQLPRALQINILDNLDKSIGFTISNLMNSPPELFNQYRESVADLHAFLKTAIDARYEDNDGQVSHPTVEVTPEAQKAASKRSSARRGTHKKDAEQPDQI